MKSISFTSIVLGGVLSVFILSACDAVVYGPGDRDHGRRGGGDRRRGHIFSFQANANNDVSEESRQIQEQNSALDLASDYQIKPSSAVLILSAINGKIDLRQLNDSGVKTEDLNTLMSGQLPNGDFVERVAGSVDEDTTKVNAIFN